MPLAFHWPILSKLLSLFVIFCRELTASVASGMSTAAYAGVSFGFLQFAVLCCPPHFTYKYTYSLLYYIFVCPYCCHRIHCGIPRFLFGGWNNMSLFCIISNLWALLVAGSKSAKNRFKSSSVSCVDNYSHLEPSVIQLVSISKVNAW